VATFNRQKRPTDEGRARAVLAEALLANGAIEDADVEAKRAVALVSDSDGRLRQLFVSVTAAHVAAVIDQKKNPQNLALDLHRLELAASQAQSLQSSISRVGGPFGQRHGRAERQRATVLGST